MNTKIRLSSCAAALALCAALGGPAVAAPTFAIGGPASVVPGETFALSVGASGVSDLYAYQFDLSFDRSLFRAVGVSAGSFLSTAGATFFDGGSIDNAAGTISFIFETLIGPGSGVSGAGELLQLSFEAIGAGSTRGAFSLANVQALDSSLNAFDVALVGRTVAIPEPSSLALALLALGVIGSARSSRRAAAGEQRAG